MAFVKLDAAILRSTIWYKRPDLELFLAALLMAEPREYLAPVNTLEVDSLKDAGFVVPPGWYGFVPASGPGLIAQAVVEEATGINALKSLGSPEKESRSQAFEGRRMVRIDGGYLVLNYMKFRDMDHTAAERQRRLRARKASLAVTRDTVTVTRDVTHSREQMQRADADIPEGLRPAWAEWNEYRKQAKLRAYTPIGAKKQVKVLVALGVTRAVAAIEYSIRQNFQGIYEERENQNGNNKSDGRPNSRRLECAPDYSGIKNHGLGT